MKKLLVNFWKENKFVFLIWLLVLVLYFPSFSTFFTNDDFFHLKISHADSLGDFLNFFNFSSKPEGYGFYRPLTTQVFYFLGKTTFGLNPFYLHVIVFVTFLGILLAMKNLIILLTLDTRVAFLTVILYTFSVFHFSHFYYLSTFQEIGVTLFVLLALYFFSTYINSHKKKDFYISIIFYVFSLMSKETAVVFPALAIIIFAFLKSDKNTINTKNLYFVLAPFAVITLIYFYFHFYVYGTPGGDYYRLDFSIKQLFNTLFWYFLWTLNIPEMFLDFIGPGINLNPNLFKFWGLEAKLIFLLFGLLVVLVAGRFLKEIFKNDKQGIKYLAFSILWFLIGMAPVAFLPMHKFAFYLTLPAIGIYLYISNLISKSNTVFGFLPIPLVFISLFLVSLSLTHKTYWSIRSAEISKRVHSYFVSNRASYENKTLVFVDTDKDGELPWLPSEVIKVALSDNNYFKVFHEGKIKALYGNNKTYEEDSIKLEARNFLGY